MCMCVCARASLRDIACLCESVLETTVMLRVRPDDHSGVMFVVLLFDYRKISAIINVD